MVDNCNLNICEVEEEDQAILKVILYYITRLD